MNQNTQPEMWHVAAYEHWQLWLPTV